MEAEEEEDIVGIDRPILRLPKMSAADLASAELATLDSKRNLGCVVRVKAQVMSRDDSTGMWVPLSGGGMSIVSLHRIPAPRPTDDDEDDDTGGVRSGVRSGVRGVGGTGAKDVVYVILGQRIADKNMALNCELLSDFRYTSVNPTFHHWTTNGRRFGLTFQTSSDATAFHRSIQRFEQNIKRGEIGSTAQLHIMAEEVLGVLQEAQNLMPSSGEKSPDADEAQMDDASGFFSGYSDASKSIHDRQSLTPRVCVKEQGLPDAWLSQLRRNSAAAIGPQSPPRSRLENTSAVSPDATTGIALGDYGLYVDIVPNSSGVDEKRQEVWLKDNAKDLGHRVGLFSLPTDDSDDLIYVSGSYVRFEKNTDPNKHEYCYPSLDSFRLPPQGRVPAPPRPACDAQRVHFSTAVPVPLPVKSRQKWSRQKKKKKNATTPCTSRPQRPQNSGAKELCIYCREYFLSEENRPGACKDAPDGFLACIKATTCVCCSEAIAYHCGDDDTDSGRTTDCGVLGQRGGCRRRALLIFICLFVPCLWCYLPLRACHRLGVSCGCCGPRHQAWR